MDDIELLINAMSAVCIDYEGVPVKPEQRLSAELLARIEAGDELAVTAIRILSSGRITKALPLIVYSYMHGALEGRTEVAEAIVRFGNIALPTVHQFIVANDSKDVRSRIVELLCAIDTPEAARLLLGCYTFWDQEVGKPIVSFAVASMLKNKFVEGDLLTLREDGSAATAGRHSLEEITWSYEPGASGAFERLALKLRDDLAGEMHYLASDPERADGRWERLASADFRVWLPALVYFIRKQRKKVTPLQWAALGFDAATGDDIAILSRIEAGILSNPPALKASIKRIAREHVASADVPQRVRLFKRPLEVILTIVFFANALLMGFVLFASLFTPGRVDYHDIVIRVSSSVVVAWFGLCLFWAARNAIPGKRMVALLMPVPMILMKMPYMRWFNPWVAFVLFQLVTVLCSPVGLLVALAITTVALGDQIPLSFGRLIQSLASQALFFVICGAIYFVAFALRVDAAALLVLRHPVGRRLFGVRGSGPRGGVSL